MKSIIFQLLAVALIPLIVACGSTPQEKEHTEDDGILGPTDGHEQYEPGELEELDSNPETKEAE